ncbi:DUF4230 domain-containing protein [Sphingomonas sp.]|uniref:DUF4230 domain-containing protein n=1 Tax=Sphingomonas sp. TaxID=28214 RepID=UPI001816BAB0|nr:DUF4230 domain-containing protein [Sphingomonas sp.]MBA3511246.1 DUF4230 domain-containing protein [Sphingomonas sp.]
MAQLKTWHLLAGTHLAAGIVGWSLAPRELLETEVEHSGFFTTDTRRVLSAAVESLRAENRLLVYSYKGVAAVSVERDGFLFLDGRQDLIVPAQVGYYVDMSDLDQDDVSFDARAAVVTVSMPPLTMGDVAFEPEGARTINGGLITFDQSEVDALSKLNYATARRAFLKQAQGEALVQVAKRQARDNVRRQIGMALRVGGRADVRVVATFRP